jgi:hypothetical protein
MDSSEGNIVSFGIDIAVGRMGMMPDRQKKW